jgi:CelD/BcsL family acetyltransferase involved in cellulose biosynthesis
VGRLGSGEATLSVGYGVVRGERFLFEGFAYNPEFARLSPSRLLLEQLVRWCFERRLAVFDLSPGNDLYKLQWADGRVAVLDEVVPLNAWGRVAAWRHGGLHRLTRLDWLRAGYRRLPKGLRHAVQALLLPGLDYSAAARRGQPA